MPSYIVKPIADRDEYVVWSTIVDAPTHVGTRATLGLILGGTAGAPERFDRADHTGSSAAGEIEGWFGWDDDRFWLGNMHWQSPESREVRRENLAAYARADMSQNTAECIALTEVVEDDDL